eukprot:jgi/Mesen1/10084/ME000074S09427
MGTGTGPQYGLQSRHWHRGLIPAPDGNCIAEHLAGAEEYQVKAFIGEGAYAKIYRAERCDAGLSGEEQEAEWADENTSVALKRSCFGRARKIFAFSDCSVLVCDYKEHGSLQDVLNAYLAAGQQMDEALCIFYTIEMLRMLEILHAARILHGDFKPDNLMVREDSDQWDDWSPLTAGSWSQKGLYLIDWGRSIDLASLPKGAMLAGDSKTDAFRSPEMLEGRPWLYQWLWSGSSGQDRMTGYNLQM